MVTRYLRELGFGDEHRTPYRHYCESCEDYSSLKATLERLDFKVPNELKTNRQESIDAKGNS